MVHFDDTESDVATIGIEYVKEFSTFRLFSDDGFAVERIVDNYTVDNPAYFYCKQAGSMFVDDKLSPFGKLGDAPLGLLTSIIRETRARNPRYEFVFQDEESRDVVAKKLFPLRGVANIKTFDDILTFDNKSLEWRDYQIECVKKVLNRGRGLISSPTASGKSLIIGTSIKNMIENEALRKACFPTGDEIVLILVPGVQLVSQMYQDLLDYGMPKEWLSKFSSNTGKKSSGNFCDNSCSGGFNKVVITNRSWLEAGHVDELPPIGVIIVDEVHTVGPKTWSYKFVKGLATNIRIGFSGTIPDSYKRWMIEGIFGEVMVRLKITDLQDQGFLTKLKIEFIKMRDLYVESDRNILFHTRSRYHFDENDTSEDAIGVSQAFQEEVAYVSKNAEHLYEVPFQKIHNDSGKKNTLFLFDRLEMGRGLTNLCKRLWGEENVHYIDGSIDVADREDVRKTLENTTGQALVAQSVTTSTGWNVRNLDNIVFCFSGKSTSKIIQSIGRTLRKLNGKDVATLYDISFNYKYSEKHLMQRIKIFKEAYGDYEKNIVQMTVRNDCQLL